MVNSIVGVEEIIANAFKICDGMVEERWLYGKKSSFAFSFVQKTVQIVPDRAYYANGGIYVFVVDGEMFVAPSTRTLQTALDLEGFKECPMYVPFSFSSNDGPEDPRQKRAWRRLCEYAKEQRREEFIQDCRKYCREHQLGGSLALETLRLCLEIPAKGIRVKHPCSGEERIYLPQISCIDANTISLAGQYNSRNGVVVFNTNDGRTFLARSQAVIEALRQANYRQSDLFVPLSGGEIIVDDFSLGIRWHDIEPSAQEAIKREPSEDKATQTADSPASTTS